VVEVGSPIWQFLLVAAVAAGLAIVVQQLVAHRPHRTSPASNAA
jgi:hypothetical protein